jgi:hypothetical protein
MRVMFPDFGIPLGRSSRHFGAWALAAWVVIGSQFLSGCAVLSLGRRPDEFDLKNDGSEEAQTALFRRYEVVYERGVVRRPGADPVAVAAEVHRPVIDDVASPAWSDDAYNYLATSEEAAELLSDPAVAFDGFAHSGNGELVILGLGTTVGALGGALSWFIPTTLRDGVTPDEFNGFLLNTGAGFAAGVGLGVVVAAAYTYTVPAMSTPLAAVHYRAAVRAFNDELEQRIVEASPGNDDNDGEEGEDPANDGGSAAGADESEASTDTPCCPGADDKPSCPIDGSDDDCCCKKARCDLSSGTCACAADCTCEACPVHGASMTPAPAEPPSSARPVEPASPPARN